MLKSAMFIAAFCVEREPVQMIQRASDQTRRKSLNPGVRTVHFHIFSCPMSYCRLGHHGLRVDGRLPSHYRGSKRLARSLEIIPAQRWLEEKGLPALSEAAEQSCRKPQFHHPSSADAGAAEPSKYRQLGSQTANW